MVLSPSQAVAWQSRTPLIPLFAAALFGAVMVPALFIAGDVVERCPDGHCNLEPRYSVATRASLVTAAGLAGLLFPFAIAMVAHTMRSRGAPAEPAAALRSWSLASGLCGTVVGSLSLVYGGYLMTTAIDGPLGFYMVFPALAVVAGLLALGQWWSLRRAARRTTDVAA